MNRSRLIVWLVALTTLLHLASPAWSQYRGVPVQNGTVGNLPATCGIGDWYWATDATAGSNLYFCTSVNTWTAAGGSTSSLAFSAITAGTNTAALVIGSGGTLGTSGSGTITATALPVTGITGLGTGMATWMATPSSANLRATVTDEAGTGALLFVAPAVDIAATAAQTVTILGVGTTAGTSGITATNTTSATSGNQKWSPCLILTGQGFSTVGSASIPVDWCLQTVPVQGSTATSLLRFYSRINGGTWTDTMDLAPNGSLTIQNGGVTTFGNINSSGSASSTMTSGATGGFIVNGKSAVKSSADGLVELFNNALNGFTRLNLGGVTSGFGAIGVTNQTNPIIKIQDGTGGDTADLQIGNQKSTTGQRFVCIDTNGKLVSSATACVGT